MKRIRTLFRGTDIKFTSVFKEGAVALTILQEASAEGTSYAQVPTSVVLKSLSSASFAARMMSSASVSNAASEEALREVAPF